MHLKDPKYSQTLRIGETLNNNNTSPAVTIVNNDPYTLHLQEMITDSCTFYERMEKKKEGAIENMLSGLRNQIDKGKVNVEHCY